MTATSLKTGTAYGTLILGSATNVAIANSGIAIAQVFIAETTDAVTHIGFRYGARVGTPCAMVATIETVDTSTGNPSGTDVGGGSPTAKIFTPPADTTWDGTWQYIALTNSASLTIGTAYAITIRFSSGTPDSSTFTRVINDRNGTMAIPYSASLSGGSWTKGAGALFSYKTASRVYGFPALSAYATTDSTAGNRVGMFFTLPSGLATSFTVAAVFGAFRFGAAAGSCKIGIWNAAGTELQSTTLDSDILTATTSRSAFVPFASPATLLVGTKYYVGVEVISGAVTSCGINLGSAGDREPFPNGLNSGLFTWNGSTYTETDTTMPQIELIFGDITAPSGGGGGCIIGS